MMEDTALATLQRSLGEAREAKRKIQTRLIEIETEGATLRSQLSSFDIIIEQTEAALRRVLFPGDVHQPPTPTFPTAPPPPSYNGNGNGNGHRNGNGYGADSGTMERLLAERLLAERAIAERYEQAAMQAADFDAEVAKLQQSEKTGNVRFNDFRIPQAATIVLREANGSLHVSEIYRRMNDGGFEFRGQHQLITLAVSLSRSKRFRKVAPGTFELVPDAEGRVA